jgi:hypothetical protein
MPKTETLHAKQMREGIQWFTTGVTAGAVALGEAMNAGPVEKGLHSSESLPKGYQDGYGPGKKVWRYTEGFTPATELHEPGITNVGIRTVDRATGDRRTVTIGRTPAAYSKAKGGDIIANAGAEADYLMVINRQGADGTKSLAFRYVDETSLQLPSGVAHGAQNITFPGNQAENRAPIQVTGQVTETFAIVN